MKKSKEEFDKVQTKSKKEEFGKKIDNSFVGKITTNLESVYEKDSTKVREITDDEEYESVREITDDEEYEAVRGIDSQVKLEYYSDIKIMERELIEDAKKQMEKTLNNIKEKYLNALSILFGLGLLSISSITLIPKIQQFEKIGIIKFITILGFYFLGILFIFLISLIWLKIYKSPKKDISKAVYETRVSILSWITATFSLMYLYRYHREIIKMTSSKPVFWIITSVIFILVFILCMKIFKKR